MSWWQTYVTPTRCDVPLDASTRHLVRWRATCLSTSSRLTCEPPPRRSARSRERVSTTSYLTASSGTSASASDMRTRYLIVFSKSGGARFLSHLDLQATLEYGMRRAELPVQLSEGFNPRPKYSLVTALPLSYAGEQELLELTLREDVPAEQVAIALGRSLPEGITVR